MADVSGGSVTKVKASELTSNFAGILANPILASQVRIRVLWVYSLPFQIDSNGKRWASSFHLDKPTHIYSRFTQDEETMAFAVKVNSLALLTCKVRMVGRHKGELSVVQLGDRVSNEASPVDTIIWWF